MKRFTFIFVLVIAAIFILSGCQFINRATELHKVENMSSSSSVIQYTKSSSMRKYKKTLKPFAEYYIKAEVGYFTIELLSGSKIDRDGDVIKIY